MINLINEEEINSKEIKNNLQKIFDVCMKQTNQKYDKLVCSLEFVDKEIIRKVNNEMRKVDKVTDVLSFPMLNLKCGEVVNEKDYPFDIDLETQELSLGDIIICLDVAKAQADEYGHSEMREICYLFLHGLLHLLGYDHMEEEDKKIMRAKEEEILEKANQKLKVG